MQTFGWKTADVPGPTLVIGVPAGQERPAIMLVQENEETVILGRFYGERQAQQAIDHINGLVDAINQTIQHYEKLNGDDV